MMRKILFFHWILLLFSFGAEAQNTSYVTGNVFDNEQRTQELQGVSVKNLSTNILVQTGKDGHYALPAKKGDLVVYSMMGYHADTVYLINLFPRNVYLRISVSNLPTVDITAAKVSPYLDIKDGSARPARRFDVSKERGGLRLNLGYGKYRREQEKERVLEEEAELNEEISKNFNRKVIEKLIHYKEDDIEGYIGLYRPSVDDVKAERPFNYSFYIATTFQEWKQLPLEARQLPPLPKLKVIKN